MPGGLSLTCDGKDVKNLALPEATLPARPGQVSYGSDLILRVFNTGTTRLEDVSLAIEGAGAKNVEVRLGVKDKGVSDKLSVALRMNPRTYKDILIRSVYRFGDHEDRREFGLAVNARSIG